jgi:hypothetical protein
MWQFFISMVGGGKCSTLRPDRFKFGESTAGINGMDDWVGAENLSGRLVNIKLSCPCW